MDIITVNSNSKLVQIASSINRSPQSWRGWKSLFINMQALNEEMQQECLFWVKSFVGSYLKGQSGRVFFSQNSTIHIIGKNIPLDILEQAGSEICELAYNESQLNIEYKIFELQEHYKDYSRYILENYTSLADQMRHQADFLEEYNEIQIQARPEVPMQSSHLSTLTQDAYKVMLVEDDPVTRWMVRNTVKGLCDFIATGNAHKAFNIYATEKPDLVFLDINLPDQSGYAVLDWIMRQNPNANVVMFSSNDHIDNITQAIEEGAKGFIAKPFVKKQLLDYIECYSSSTKH